MMQSASIRHLEIIGEAASHASTDLKKKYLNVEWREMIALRNFVIHEYYKIHIEAIWMTIKEDLPPLK